MRIRRQEFLRFPLARPLASVHRADIACHGLRRWCRRFLRHVRIHCSAVHVKGSDFVMHRPGGGISWSNVRPRKGIPAARSFASAGIRPGAWQTTLDACGYELPKFLCSLGFAPDYRGPVRVGNQPEQPGNTHPTLIVFTAVCGLPPKSPLVQSCHCGP